MTTEEERRSLLRKIAERDVQEIYEFAMKRSEEIKRAALSDPEFEDKVLDAAGRALCTPAFELMNRHIAIALAVATAELSLTEAKIIVKRLTWEITPQAIDEAKEYMYRTGEWERPEENDGETEAP